MAFPRSSLSAFLGNMNRSLAECIDAGRKINIVIGNESADLDSFTSSLLYAYIRSSFPPTTAFSPVYVPILNIPRSGIRIRPEFAIACKHAGIQTSSLLTLDELSEKIIGSDHVRWFLVDHNKLTGRLESVSPVHVTGAIDHHEEEHFIPPTTEPEPRIIENAGSCTSLVTRYLRPSWDAISSSSLSTGAAHGQGDGAIDDSAFIQAWDSRVAKLALVSILIDTSNLTSRDKTKPSDEEAVRYLEARIMMVPREAISWNRDTFYQEIYKTKHDIEPLTLDEILIKDYKQWTESGLHLGTSSVVRDLSFLVVKAERGEGKPNNTGSHFSRVLDDFMNEKDLVVFAIMTHWKSIEGESQRQLLLQARSSSPGIVTAFLEAAMEDLKLEKFDLKGFEAVTNPAPGTMWRQVWWQRDVSKSRKLVAPILRRAMQK